ncbi:hypothetical protein [Brucella rhizosphaerae]|uniref:hypothetical protein n=1 Tax=Brucella rhizosphaerae TaxID=571254 RepID=UPI003613EC66
MSIKDDAVLSQLKEELERLRLELKDKEELISEQTQALSHVKKYTVNLLLSLRSAFGSAHCPRKS